MTQLETLAFSVSEALRRKQYRLATAESCTGGWVSEVLTALPRSSDWFEGGVVSYSNAVKQSLLAVPAVMLEAQGAVSEAVAQAMAQGVMSRLRTDVGLGITGIAGPGGGTPEKPVGTVWIGWASATEVMAQCYHFTGTRQQVRSQAVATALEGLLAIIRRSNKML